MATLRGKIADLKPEYEALAKDITEVDTRLEKLSADQKDIAAQQQRLRTALKVIDLQVAALALRELSFKDAKAALVARREANMADQQFFELQTKDKWGGKLIKGNPSDGMDYTKKYNNLLGHTGRLHAKVVSQTAQAEKSRDAADAATIKVAREAAALTEDKALPSASPTAPPPK